MIRVVVLFLAVFFQPQQAEAKAVQPIDMEIIAQIESSGNPNAFNPRTKAYGLYQVTPICLQDFNNMHPKERYMEKDLFKPSVNTRVANWYMNERVPQLLEHFGHPVTLENQIVAYNAGVGFVRRPPKESLDYIGKYKKLYGTKIKR